MCFADGGLIVWGSRSFLAWVRSRSFLSVEGEGWLMDRSGADIERTERAEVARVWLGRGAGPGLAGGDSSSSGVSSPSSTSSSSSSFGGS